ncbi:hypothetical protein [Elongatibacter sediminis]|uniref:Lipoprotein n=1 Tax=Elongatibacter sediminis TaxID=3119006 RepID=A0AAW9R9J2_9GAMM
MKTVRTHGKSCLMRRVAPASGVGRPLWPGRWLALPTLPLLLSACMSTTVIDQHRVTSSAPVEIGDESVVVLGRRQGAGQETEIDFISCVGEQLGNSRNGLSVIPEKQFVDGMYPYFEASTAPSDVKNLDRLVQNPAVAEKLTEFRVRYFVWIDGFTERVDERGSMSCSIGPGGGGCFGFASWDDEANYEATIWDFESLELSAKVSARTTGTSYMPAVFVPIPLLARVQSNACRNMARQIAQQLTTAPG